MGMLKVNPQAEASSDFPTFQPGAYRMRIVEVKNRNPEKNDLKVTLEYADIGQLVKLDGTPYTGSAEGAGKLFDYVMLDPEKHWKLRQLTEAAGLPWTDYDPETDLPGAEITVKVKLEPYEGEQKNKVARYVK